MFAIPTNQCFVNGTDVQRRQGNDLAGVRQIEQPEVVAGLNPEQTCRALVANTGQPSRQVRLKFSKTASLSHKKADG